MKDTIAAMRAVQKEASKGCEYIGPDIQAAAAAVAPAFGRAADAYRNMCEVSRMIHHQTLLEIGKIVARAKDKAPV